MSPVIDQFDGAYRFLSNFCFCTIDMGDGLIYPSVEHAFQAAKTDDMNERRRIANMPTAAQAKRAGRRVTLRPNWDSIKRDVMLELVRMKFNDNPDLAAELIATGNATLIEGNWWGDTYWGVCRGVGQNHLGRILMTVREDLIKRSSVH